ncbi:putative lactam utilization protein B-like protein [Frankia casuarinae]|uniref:5-oxoprolinase subunit A n=1 Tax=Frankia casuarinae (strain DSM 45818 / CECT 9043 / HFP020203 / CcI3) TaxID=106370 RepID=Q2J8R2_FRACC|nr:MULTISPECIES: 5-oxoprolinase subunit PxpA [Frankia]ABD12330.1 LamB/YcsF [Frankia casuarinae]ETA02406.1 putative lactam utilization protein B-like protein [Frankia sp. CcI6]EYT91572.1 putative lactam utilization protein B-like protein [Frankia casuarinae]KDA44852.1 putative lactam utilization protein B-like protein [Frankia sp. BMG5.23]KEZ35806.1 putative lactam utilization protein B-like protein [Frankia sp. CeD]
MGDQRDPGRRERPRPDRATTGEADPPNPVEPPPPAGRAHPVAPPPPADPPRPLDLNADLGEGFGVWRLTEDEALLDLVTSANIACGFHAGDPATMRRTCEQAVRCGVRIGAQVSYRDLAGFGRRRIDMDPDDLRDDVLYQLGALDAFARTAGDRVRYVKPHGALYNAIVTDEEQAQAVVEAIRCYDATLPVLGLPGSAWLRRASEAGLTAVGEAFADRDYTAAGTLVSRRTAGAVLHDPDVIVARGVRMAIKGVVVSQQGTPVDVGARSLCVHGDTPGAVEMVRRLRQALFDAGVPLIPFS